MTAANSPTVGSRREHRTERLEWLVLLLALAAVIGAAAWSGNSTPDHFATAQVKADQGDTLWSLAVAHPIEGLTTAQTASLIAELNDVSAQALAAGSTLRVPAAASGDSYAMR